MTNKLRFHLDEQGNPRIASGLQRRGIDVTTTVDAGLRTVDDLGATPQFWMNLQDAYDLSSKRPTRTVERLVKAA